jgi:hypothetical protein
VAYPRILAGAVTVTNLPLVPFGEWRRAHVVPAATRLKAVVDVCALLRLLSEGTFSKHLEQTPPRQGRRRF